MPVRFPHRLKMEVSSANVARRDQRAFRCGRKKENAVAFASVSGTAAVVALRLRSSRLSAPLHFSARRTADRSSSLFFTMQPSDGNFQTLGNGRNFVIHQIAFLPLNAGNGGLVENDAFDGQAASQIVLRNRRLAFQARFPNPPTDDVPARQLMSFFQNM